MLIVLTVTLDNHLAPSSEGEIRRLLEAFAAMQEKSMGMPADTLQFLMRKNEAEAARPMKETDNR